MICPTIPIYCNNASGGLDRIGQKETIQIHVPYLENSQEEVLYQWYDEGLDAFHVNNSAATRVAELLHDRARSRYWLNPATQAIADLIADTQELNTEIETQLQHGRDLLLELNSCRKDVAIDLDRPSECCWKSRVRFGLIWKNYIECYGVETEFHSPDCFIITPGDHMRVSGFPGLQEDGITVTTNRQIALAREDMQFFTWEHPYVSAAMDLVLSSETGNAAISVIRNNDLKPGQFLLECLFIVECSAPAELQISRFLPATPIRILIDQNMQDLSLAIEHRSLIAHKMSYEQAQIVEFINNQREHISKILSLANKNAKTAMQSLVSEATKVMLESLTTEIKRLVRLKKVNPSIKAEEIETLKDMVMLAHEHLQEAQIRLDAVRFLITS